MMNTAAHTKIHSMKSLFTHGTDNSGIKIDCAKSEESCFVMEVASLASETQDLHWFLRGPCR